MQVSTTNWRRRAVRLAASTAGVAAMAAAAVPSAQAAFTLPACGGGAITGEGSSFQNAAEIGWESNFQNPLECGSTAPKVTYNPTGSGAGIAAMGGNGTGLTATDRFAGTDDPPTPTQVSNMDTNTTGAGIHVVPTAVGALAMIVNYPAGCTIPAANAWHGGRFHVSNATLEAAWAADPSMTTWGQLLPGISELSGSGLAPGTCAATPIQRVVRFDVSGSTFAFKTWLKARNPNRGWVADGSTTWPGTTLNGGANGGGSLANKVAATPGSIGYADLATSRSHGFDKTSPVPPEAGSLQTFDPTFWIPVDDNATDTTPQEPTTAANGYLSGSSTKGANCAAAQFTGVPSGTDPTLNGNWTSVNAAGSPTGYPICLLTYDLAWDDYSKVSAYGTDQASARTVKDYFTNITSADGQASLASPQNDYTPLPATLLQIAQTGVAAIGWNK